MIFHTDSVLKHTVDFIYTDPVTLITTPTYSIPGESSILLSSLLQEFGIYKDLTNSRVTYTDDTQLECQTVENEIGTVLDWNIISLKPFDTNELLTVYLANGDIIRIDVTDVPNIQNTVDPSTMNIVSVS